MRDFDEGAYEASIDNGEDHDTAVKRAFGEKVEKKTPPAKKKAEAKEKGE